MTSSPAPIPDDPLKSEIEKLQRKHGQTMNFHVIGVYVPVDAVLRLVSAEIERREKELYDKGYNAGYKAGQGKGVNRRKEVKAKQDAWVKAYLANRRSRNQ